MSYMPVLSVRVSDEEKEAWVEEAGGSRKLSEWIRGRCNARPLALIENGRTWIPKVGVLAERGLAEGRDRTPAPQNAPRSASARDFTPDFKKPKPEAKRR